MISYLSGKIILKKEGLLILEVNGVGYEVFLALPSMSNIAEVGQTLKLFCYLDVNERGLKLFGFLTYEELELFKIIRNIQGVGPKASLEISAFGSLAKIKTLLDKGESKFLSNIPGIGPQKASKIILELSGKIKALSQSKPKPQDPLENDEAFLALLNLGFSKEQARKALSEVPPEIKNPQDKVKHCLQILGKYGKR